MEAREKSKKPRDDSLKRSIKQRNCSQTDHDTKKKKYKPENIRNEPSDITTDPTDSTTIRWGL